VHDIKSYLPENPIDYSWMGAARYARDAVNEGRLRVSMVTKRDYLEYGHDFCNRKNASGWQNSPEEVE
jgi:actin-related protein